MVYTCTCDVYPSYHWSLIKNQILLISLTLKNLNVKNKQLWSKSSYGRIKRELISALSKICSWASAKYRLAKLSTLKKIKLNTLIPNTLF